MNKRDYKYILLGGQKKKNGPVANPGSINYESGAFTSFWRALAAVCIPPLLFVQSSAGIIPYEYPSGYAELTWTEQYLQSFAHIIIQILDSFFGGGGFPPDIPKPMGLGWKIAVSALFLLSTFAAAGLFFSCFRKIHNNIKTYKTELNDG